MLLSGSYLDSYSRGAWFELQPVLAIVNVVSFRGLHWNPQANVTILCFTILQYYNIMFTCQNSITYALISAFTVHIKYYVSLLSYCHLGVIMVSVLATEPKARGFKPVRGRARLPSEGKQSRRFRVVKFYDMSKNSTKYERDIS
jgi:hypothetical protein